MAEEEGKTLGEDGLFKLLTWRSSAITRIFDLPAIKGEPLQQEFADPMARRVDRLYRLADGSLLNIEHQSSLRDKNALARRMATYRIMIRGHFRRIVIRQVVVFTGAEPRDRSRIGKVLTYEDVDADGNGIRFTAVVKDFLSVPVAVFRQSGEIDDYILGILASGGGDPRYVQEVATKIAPMRGEEGRSAREKFVAVCVIRGAKTIIGAARELEMWMEDAKNNPVGKLFLEIVGRDRFNEQSRRTLARVLLRHAAKRGLTAPENAETVLVTHASEEVLFDMVEDMTSMTDFGTFVRSYGVDILEGDS
jgi:hypothetical protein